MLRHRGTVELHTPRLTLRRFTQADAQAMFDAWAHDARVTRFLTWAPHASPETTRELLEGWCARYAEPACYNWAMEHEGKLIGNISVVRHSEQSESAELGYCMGYDFWNRGLMTEAVSAVRDFLFGEVGFHRLEISHAVKNPGSGRVAQKCGFRYEGTKRDYFKCSGGEYLDIAFTGLLRSDWENERRV